jgi:hypothetical protein
MLCYIGIPSGGQDFMQFSTRDRYSEYYIYCVTMMPFCNARVHKTGIDHLIIFLSGRGYNIILQYTTARATHIIMIIIIILYIYIYT